MRRLVELMRERKKWRNGIWYIETPGPDWVLLHQCDFDDFDEASDDVMDFGYREHTMGIVTCVVACSGRDGFFHL